MVIYIAGDKNGNSECKEEPKIKEEWKRPLENSEGWPGQGLIAARLSLILHFLPAIGEKSRSFTLNAEGVRLDSQSPHRRRRRRWVNLKSR